MTQKKGLCILQCHFSWRRELSETGCTQLQGNVLQAFKRVSRASAITKSRAGGEASALHKQRRANNTTSHQESTNTYCTYRTSEQFHLPQHTNKAHAMSKPTTGNQSIINNHAQKQHNLCSSNASLRQDTTHTNDTEHTTTKKLTTTTNSNTTNNNSS